MRIVAALGGNALLRRGEPPEIEVQRGNVARAAAALAPIACEHALVVTHGNGPQVGLLAIESGAGGARPYPLDVLGAESEGMIGYLIEQELHGRLPGRAVATLLTQVEVSLEDPAFAHPTKPIGPVYGESEARRLAAERGWSIGPDGRHWRRTVPSPEPRRILELDTIELLVRAGVVVICAGGGGVPVVVTPEGGIRGVEAVIDKDLSAALLAAALKADALLMLTDVDAVYRDWGEPGARRILRAAPRHLRSLAWAPGSMGPKVEAACRFVERGGALAAIGALEDASLILAGHAGTSVRSDAPALEVEDGAG
ncbi:MAG: carbamate kinase [Alphaproteobacteria bacterium]